MHTYIIQQFIEQCVLYMLLNKLNFTSGTYCVDVAVQMYQSYTLRMAL